MTDRPSAAGPATATHHGEYFPPATRRIARLPALLVNQIAAGEVIERPASVVKELLDNALDAGARTITLELQQGGIELIRVTDDGRGMPPDDLPLALAPHATSKIARPEDLDAIATMGFRGEALASICSVARVSLRSRTPGADAAAQIDAEGETITPPRPAAGPVGTTVTVRNLFFNTPARRKFLRTVGTEQGHCADAACELALSHPAIGFTIIADRRTIADLPPDQRPRERVLAVLGGELDDELIEVRADELTDPRGVALWGLVGTPALARASARSQHIFLNGRPIRDKTIQHALRESYRGLIEPGRYPTAVLMLVMHPGAFDANVHPAKVEVRFRDQSLVHGLVLRTVREALRAADLTPPVTSPVPPRLTADVMGGSGHAALAPNTIPTVGITPAQFVDSFTRRAPTATERLDYQALQSTLNLGRAPHSPGDEHAVGLEHGGGPPPAPPAPPAPEPVDGIIAPPRPADRVLQIHNSYVVTQDEDGIVIVDQHALHERVMFEALLERAQRPLESQRLLVPATVPASPKQLTRLDDLRPLLDRIGVAIEPSGPATAAVHAFPTFLFDRGVEPAEFIGELLERADADGFAPGSEEALHEVLDMMACKAAVKAGDHLAEQELHALLTLRERVERASNCPHGRPTSIRLSIRELERRFGRT